MPQSPEAMAQTMLANIEDKTGKPLADWQTLLKAAGLEKHGEMVKFLKADHGVTHGFANLIVHEYRNQGAKPATEEDLVSTQYAGPKSDLRPIYEALVSKIADFGDDVELAPKKAYVSLRRHKQFGLIQPSTKTRVDVGLNMKGEATTDRLEASGSFNAMCSHRVRLSSIADVDEELIDWLRQAYEKA